MPNTLLLADDSVTIQRVIELTFADEDVKVIAVSDGDEAIERAESSPPDIVLADIAMPGKSGYEVAKHIKQSPMLSHIPVILLTGAFEPVDQERASEAGCDGVLAKPFEPQLVISRVKDLLAKSTARTSTTALPISPASAAVAPPSAALVGAPPPPAAAPPPAVAPAEDDTLTLPSADKDWNIQIGQTLTPGAVAANRNESLDDYFDRLDSAFQNLGGRTSAPAAAPAADLPDVDWFGPDPSRVGPPSEPWDFPAPAAAGSATETPDYPFAHEAGELAADSDKISDASVAIPAEPAAALPVAHAPAELPRITALPSLADAFAAILAAEQSVPAAASWPATTPSTDALVNQVTQRVLERLSDQVIRATVSDIVSQIAERLVHEEIERIKGAIK